MSSKAEISNETSEVFKTSEVFRYHITQAVEISQAEATATVFHDEWLKPSVAFGVVETPVVTCQDLSERNH